MEKCAKLLIDGSGKITKILGEVSCNPAVQNTFAVPRIGYLIAGGIALLLVFLSIVIVKQQNVKIVERLGRYKKIMSPGLNFKIPFVDRIAGVVDLRIQQLNVKVETKTKDNVFVTIPIAVQFFVTTEKVKDAFYKLADYRDQITAYVFDTVRAQVPTMNLDDVFEKKNQIAQSVKLELSEIMDDFGYSIVTALVTDIDPDAKVKDSMNEINAQSRLREAAKEKGEAEKIVIVKQAEAEAESKRLQGEGIAQQRMAIASGLKKSVDMFKDSKINEKEVLTTVMLTQYFDTMKDIGKDSRVIFLPHTPNSVNDISNQIRNAMLQANEGSASIISKE